MIPLHVEDMTIIKICVFQRRNLGLVFCLDGIYRIHRTTCPKILKSCSSVRKPSLDAHAPCVPAAWETLNDYGRSIFNSSNNLSNIFRSSLMFFR